MPNHLHGILVLDDSIFDPNKVKDTDILEQRAFKSPARGSLIRIMASFKAAVTRQVRRLEEEFSDVPFWQKRFHDRVIRSEKELWAKRQYIYANPAKWAADEYYKDLGWK